MKTHKLYRNQAEFVLKQTGKFFGATYRKKNGELTKINGRFGVHKFVKGTGQSSPSVWTIWENNRKRYTSLVPENVIDITCNGVKWELE